MNLPTTKPNDRDIAWYIRECEDLRNRLESLAESNKKQTDDYVCVDRERGLYRRASHARDAVSADRLALALSLETLDELQRENAALREDKERLDWLEECHGWPEYIDAEWHFGGEVFSSHRAAIDAARKEAKL